MIRRHAARKTLALAALAGLVYVTPLLAQKTERAKALGKRLMCVCGCNQILTECNHVGCSYSYRMLKELDERVARNEPDDLTLQAFVQEYGSGVLAQPASRGLGLWAWLMPIVAVTTGFYVVRLVIVRWRHRAVAAPVPKVPPELLARAKRQTDEDDF